MQWSNSSFQILQSGHSYAGPSLLHGPCSCVDRCMGLRGLFGPLLCAASCQVCRGWKGLGTLHSLINFYVCNKLTRLSRMIHQALWITGTDPCKTFKCLHVTFSCTACTGCTCVQTTLHLGLTSIPTTTCSRPEHPFAADAFHSGFSLIPISCQLRKFIPVLALK